MTNFMIDIEVKGSDHAPVKVTLYMKDVCPFTSNALDERAKSLGVSIYEHKNITPQKSLNHHRICMVSFSNLMNVTNPPIVNHKDINSITEVIKESEGLIMHTTKLCRKAQRHRVINNDISYWERLIASNDSKPVWRAIDWKGQYNIQQIYSIATDTQFKQHFESLLYNENQSDISDMVEITHDSPYLS